MGAARRGSGPFGSVISAGLILALVGWAGAGAAREPLRARIDRLWADEERPQAGEACRMYMVQTLPPIMRGSASGRGCVVRAVSAARGGDRNLAVNWLKAGYCRDSDARRQIDAASEEALDYAVRTYGARVP